MEFYWSQLNPSAKNASRVHCYYYAGHITAERASETVLKIGQNLMKKVIKTWQKNCALLFWTTCAGIRRGVQHNYSCTVEKDWEGTSVVSLLYIRNKQLGRHVIQ